MGGIASKDEDKIQTLTSEKKSGIMKTEKDLTFLYCTR